MRVELLQLNAFNVVSTCTYCIPMRDDMIWSPSLVVRIVNWKVSGWRERERESTLMSFYAILLLLLLLPLRHLVIILLLLHTLHGVRYANAQCAAGRKTNFVAKQSRRLQLLFHFGTVAVPRGAIERPLFIIYYYCE